jgi:hypothetical protein
MGTWQSPRWRSPSQTGVRTLPLRSSQCRTIERPETPQIGGLKVWLRGEPRLRLTGGFSTRLNDRCSGMLVEPIAGSSVLFNILITLPFLFQRRLSVCSRSLILSCTLRVFCIWFPIRIPSQKEPLVCVSTFLCPKLSKMDEISA